MLHLIFEYLSCKEINLIAKSIPYMSHCKKCKRILGKCCASWCCRCNTSPPTESQLQSLLWLGGYTIDH